MFGTPLQCWNVLTLCLSGKKSGHSILLAAQQTTNLFSCSFTLLFSISWLRVMHANTYFLLLLISFLKVSRDATNTQGVDFCSIWTTSTHSGSLRNFTIGDIQVTLLECKIDWIICNNIMNYINDNNVLIALALFGEISLHLLLWLVSWLYISTSSSCAASLCITTSSWLAHHTLLYLIKKRMHCIECSLSS